MNIDIKHIAKLARLKIEDEKYGKFLKEMGDIIGMCENLPEMSGKLEVDATIPMELRADIIEPSLRRDDILKNAPQKQSGCIVVPKIVE